MRGGFDGATSAQNHISVSVSDVAPDTIMCALSGEVDTASEPFLRKKLTEVTALAPAHVVIDLSDVIFFGSCGLKLLLELEGRQQAVDHQLAVVVGRNRVVRRALRITELDRTLNLHTRLSSAVQACRYPQLTNHSVRQRYA